MKKILILAAALFTTAFAQAQSEKFIKVGIKGGANFSNIIKDDGNNNFSTDYIVGFNAGLTLDIHLVGPLTFSPELVYSTKGYKSTSTFGEFRQTTNFLEIPILASIKLGESFSLVAGPQVSFLLSTNNKFENGFGSGQQQIVEDESDRFKKSLLGGVIGFKVDVGGNVDVFGRYALDFQKNNENGSTTTPEYKNQVFQVGLGIKF